jgi:DDE superfamily endonuclease
MEDVLDVYQRPYDPLRPVICFDEKSKELHSTPRKQIQAKPGSPLKEDYEYERHGTCNLFLWVEPLAGQRNVSVTNRRTSVDFAEQIRDLVDVHYSNADKVVLVMDNLNTHHSGALYERFSPEEAHRINSKIEWHYTPEHASWLNMAEIELSVLSRQCVNERIPDIQTLRDKTNAWTNRRNNQKTTIQWQFKTSDARIKLRRLYPASK